MQTKIIQKNQGKVIGGGGRSAQIMVEEMIDVTETLRQSCIKVLSLEEWHFRPWERQDPNAERAFFGIR